MKKQVHHWLGGAALLALLALGYAAENVSHKAASRQVEPAAKVEQAVDVRAYAFTLAVIYHTGCEKLPDQLMYGITLEMKNIPEAVLAPATTKIHKEMVSDGSGAAWCARTKPIIWKHIKDSQ